MKLYYSPTSPYARKVRVAALELGVMDRIELVATNPRDPSTGLWSLNPLAQVPTLTTDEGWSIFDSPIICQYLNEAIGDGRLMPTAHEDRWHAATLVALADGVIDAAMSVRLENMRPETERSPNWVKKQFATAHRGLDEIQAQLSRFATSVHLGAIGVGCAISWIQFRHPDQDWLGGRDRLASWYDGFSTRPSMAATAPK